MGCGLGNQEMVLLEVKEQVAMQGTVVVSQEPGDGTQRDRQEKARWTQACCL